jgi:Fic family protein
VSYEPQFSISPQLLALVEEIAALRERILGASIELSWIPALQKDTRIRNVHASTAIEGNPLTLEQVRAIEEGRPLAASETGAALAADQRPRQHGTRGDMGSARHFPPGCDGSFEPDE